MAEGSAEGSASSTSAGEAAPAGARPRDRPTGTRPATRSGERGEAAQPASEAPPCCSPFLLFTQRHKRAASQPVLGWTEPAVAAKSHAEAAK
jgi:hypothetical protein